MSYYYTKEILMGFQESITRLKESLKKEGFGVLTEINIKTLMKEKLNENYENYVILGVCNPSFAHKALQSEYEIGLMLPCKIIAYTKNTQTFISTIIPSVSTGIIHNSKLRSITQEIDVKLRNVIDSL